VMGVRVCGADLSPDTAVVRGSFLSLSSRSFVRSPKKCPKRCKTSRTKKRKKKERGSVAEECAKKKQKTKGRSCSREQLPT
jgi:hypothetical protein